jgi:diguanylate cyclase (GGDEF)-like protein
VIKETIQQSGRMRPPKRRPDPALTVSPSLTRTRAQYRSPAQAGLSLAQTLKFLARIDGASSLAETASLSRELLDSAFASARLALGWREGGGDSFSVAGGAGVPLQGKAIPGAEVSGCLGGQGVKRQRDNALWKLLATVQARTITSFPLAAGGVLLGFICFFDCELPEGELLLVELIVSRVAAKLMLLRKEGEQAEQSELSSRMTALADAMLGSESKQELYRIILESATDLSRACQGSVMLLERDGLHLQVVQAKGMGSEVARYLSVQVGTGIAGGVASSGSALLVLDVEKDRRTARRNRPRFQSKSLISLPLKLNGKVIGVLNLSDKANRTSFCEADLKLLTTFSTFASLMIERSQVREETSRLEQLSTTDPLTGTYNRRYLSQRLEEELNRSLHQGLEFTILFLDLDHFKGFNDRFGHLAGDEALQKVSAVIKAALRDMDIVARFGGEEFCVLLPGTSKCVAQLVAERIRLEVEREVYLSTEAAHEARLTVSLGIASFPEDGATVTALLNASDAALYQAKANGRNRFVSAQPARAGAHRHSSLPNGAEAVLSV